jgi:hypothetical protein
MAGKPQPRMSVVQPLYTSYRYIPLTHNLVAIVDADNYEWLMTFSWSACKDSKGIVYAISNITARPRGDALQREAGWRRSGQSVVVKR